jgi:hypothetical protein
VYPRGRPTGDAFFGIAKAHRLIKLPRAAIFLLWQKDNASKNNGSKSDNEHGLLHLYVGTEGKTTPAMGLSVGQERRKARAIAQFLSRPTAELKLWHSWH